MGITRKQLKDFRATDHLIKRLTKALEPIGREGRAYEYNIKQVLNSICSLINTPKIHKKTKATLAHLEIEVSGLVEDTITDERLLKAMRSASEANARFEQTARESRRIAEEFQDYKRKCNLDSSPRNNIVVFTG